MTYLERKQEIDQKMSLQRVSNAECELAYSELICDMAEEIAAMATHIEDLEDDLRKYTEEDWNKRAYEG